MAIYTDIKREEAQTIFSKIGKIKTLEGIQEGVENTNYKVILENNINISLLYLKKEQRKKICHFSISPCEFKKNGIPLSYCY